MPASDTVDNASGNTTSPRHAAGSPARRPREGVGDDSQPSLLGPILNNIPFASLKGFLPLSQEKAGAAGAATSSSSSPPIPQLSESSATWQDVDLGDGHISRVLLLSSARHALQVFALRHGVIPDDPHVREQFPPPEEVASIPDVVYEADVKASALHAIRPLGRPAKERVLHAHVLPKTFWGKRGPVVALTVHSAGSPSPPHGHIALVLVSLASGKAFQRVDLGVGVTAAVSSSPRVIAVTMSHPTPTIHLFDRNLSSIHYIHNLPSNPHTLLPVASLSGRLLAFATTEPSATPGADGLGSIVTAASSTRLRASSGSARPTPPPTTQGALLTSAVEIGGGVARGVWAGLKMGAKAASQASGGRLATSAPAERGPLEAENVYAAESRSVEDGALQESGSAARPPAGVWIKIIDVQSSGSATPELIAHFRLPPTRSLVASPRPSGSNGRHVPSPGAHPVTFLSFSPRSSRLFAAASDGRAFHLLDVRPRGAAAGKRSACKGEVWASYVLRRGNTSAVVRSASWSSDERWIAVGTGKGTIHVFPINPSGGKPSASSHTSVKVPNPVQQQPLSIEVGPYARLRPLATPAEGESEAAPRSFALATFGSTRLNPLDKEVLLQDVAIYHPATSHLDLARLAARRITSTAQQPPIEGSPRRSNLTEMMREKAGLLPDGDLAVESELKSRWAMPMGGGPAEETAVALRLPSKAPLKAAEGNSLRHAEIRTHSSSLRLLPPSIYLSPQVEFFGAVPTDDYSPLSVLDKVARTKRMVYRPEIEVHPATPDANSFGEPLNSALHSVLESRPAPQLPQLPNGSPSKASLWNSIPIRQVTANIGDGVERVRREYARAQHARQRRREMPTGSSLSFEDDTVFATAADDAESSLSSGQLPTTSSSVADDERDEEWGDGWEEEYKRAVEDEGPDDLVLGLMDEQEEERKRWEAKQKEMVAKYEKM
ncbi:hypothetical protein Q8F55_000398 [Vanrija albida]|uniref:BCAS3 WD40 domain-containing protein n=1 Tax=Vanrija albida TaxID=181172 RepID=A0ABR3QE48_9TREE